MRVMMWQLSHAWYGEVVRAQVIQAVGEKAAAELEIDYPDENPLTLTDGIEFNQLNLDGARQIAHSPFLDRGLGSNAWAVSGHKSVTGKPYLCNDMHLALSLPGLWYHAHLVSGDFHVSGVTLPGMPCVLVGHNAHIAWGMTLAFTDCEDLFVEKFDPDMPTRYQTENGWQDAQIIAESIEVKGRSGTHRKRAGHSPWTGHLRCDWLLARTSGGAIHGFTAITCFLWMVFSQPGQRLDRFRCCDENDRSSPAQRSLRRY